MSSDEDRSVVSVDEAMDRAGRLLIRLGLCMMLMILYYLYYLMLHEKQGGTLGFGPEIYIYLAGVALLRRSAWGYRQSMHVLKFIAITGPIVIVSNLAALLYVTYWNPSHEFLEPIRWMLGNTATLFYIFTILVAYAVSTIPSWRYWRALRKIDVEAHFREMKPMQRFSKTAVAICVVYGIACVLGVVLAFRASSLMSARSHYSADELPPPSLYWRSEIEGPEEWRSFVLAFQDVLRSNRVPYVNLRDLDVREEDVLGPLLPDGYYTFDITNPRPSADYYGVSVCPYIDDGTLTSFVLFPTQEDWDKAVRGHQYLKGVTVEPWSEETAVDLVSGTKHMAVFPGFSNMLVFIESHPGSDDTALTRSLLDACRVHLIEGQP